MTYSWGGNRRSGVALVMRHGDIPAFTPVKLVTLFRDPGGMQG